MDTDTGNPASVTTKRGGHNQGSYGVKELIYAYAMTRNLDDDEKSNLRIAGFGPQSGGKGITAINESGLYASILNCTKPEVKPPNSRFGFSNRGTRNIGNKRVGPIPGNTG